MIRKSRPGIAKTNQVAEHEANRDVELPLSFAGPPPSQHQLHPLDSSLLKMLHASFGEHAGPDSRLDAKDLQRSLNMREAYLAERLLAVLDQDGDGVVTRAEFLDRVRRLIFGTVNDKLRFAFRIHDLNSDNVIERAELLRMITLCMAEEETLANARSAQELTDLLLRTADVNNNGRLSYREFEAVVFRYPDVLDLITRCEAQWISPNEDLLEHFREDERRGEKVKRFLENRWAALAFLVIWILANAGLFAGASLRYHELGANAFVIVARGAGACINLNGALILLPVMRRLLSRVRKAPLLRWLPIDDALGFHRLLGHTLFGMALLHTLAHLMNYHLNGAGIRRGLFDTPAGASGFALLLVFGWMWFWSRPAVRRPGRFEVFYFSHLLYVPWFVLCLLHGAAFYLWAGIPLLVFAAEQAWRLSRRAPRIEIIRAEPLRSGVTRLEVARPKNFVHSAGDYAFIRIPALARHEWHPFTISSAPEREHLSMHVRTLGNFTRALRELAESRQQPGQGAPLPAYLDGPYGTASGHIFEVSNAVMIAAGIGVTPFASVLESIVLRAHQGQGQLAKAHFFWLNRDAYSFEWFAALLMHLERIDTQKLVDIHVYLTGGKGHITSAALNVARDISYQLGNPDPITGLRSKTHMGRPDWYTELQKIAVRHAPEPVDVFFCGPFGLARELKRHCRRLGMRFRQEHF